MQPGKAKETLPKSRTSSQRSAFSNDGLVPKISHPKSICECRVMAGTPRWQRGLFQNNKERHQILLPSDRRFGRSFNKNTFTMRHSGSSLGSESWGKDSCSKKENIQRNQGITPVSCSAALLTSHGPGTLGNDGTNYKYSICFPQPPKTAIPALGCSSAPENRSQWWTAAKKASWLWEEQMRFGF